jgi:hypothetical protein
MSTTEEDLRKAQTDLARKQARWESYKAVAAIAAAAAIFMGFVLAGITWLHPRPQEITVHLDQPFVIQQPPATH